MAKPNPNEVQRTAYYSPIIADTLTRGAVVDHLYYRSPLDPHRPRRSVFSSDYRKIGKYFAEKRVIIKEYSSSQDSSIASYEYNGLATIRINKYKFERDRDLTIVHEATHMLQDLGGIVMRGWEAEFEAFFAQMLVFRGQRRSPKGLPELEDKMYKIVKRVEKRGVSYYDSQDFRRKRDWVKGLLIERYGAEDMHRKSWFNGLKIVEPFDDL